jgi:hypothetical protein
MGPGDFGDDERLGLLNLLTEAIEADPYPLSPRVRWYRQFLVRFGPLGGLLPPPASDCDHYFRPLTMRQRIGPQHLRKRTRWQSTGSSEVCQQRSFRRPR